MIFFLSSHSQKKASWLLVIYVLVFVSFIEYLGLLDVVRLAGRQVVTPAMKVNVRLVSWFGRPLRHLRRLNKAAHKVEDLEHRYAEASVLLSELEGLRAENQALRGLLENTDRKLDRVIVTAPILSFARPMLAVGAEDGVRPGAMVLSANTMLGLVIEVEPRQSRVRLLSQANSDPILARTESGAQGLVVGDGRQVLLTELPIDQEIQLNERVVTLGQEGVAKDVFIGRIIAFKSSPLSSATKIAILEQYVSFYEALVVEVK